MESIKNRLKEPSSWAGIGLLMGAGQQYFTSPEPSPEGVLTALLTGLLALFLGERNK